MDKGIPPYVGSFAARLNETTSKLQVRGAITLVSTVPVITAASGLIVLHDSGSVVCCNDLGPLICLDVRDP